MERVVLRRGTYLDSVALMLISREASAQPGVREAAALAATPLNLELLAGRGFRVLEEPLDPNDLIVAVRAESDEAARLVLDLIEQALTRGSAKAGEEGRAPASLSVTSAARRDLGLSVLVVAVPGRHAAYEVGVGLEAGLHVFCFSAGIDLRAEARLKQRAAKRGLLLMGPDCGTAVLDGVGFGFANAVRRGPVGIVGASGTGMQQVMCLLDSAGVGISQAIGVGSRDLSAEVGGAMARRGLGLLADDPGTEAILIVSKPADPAVIRDLSKVAASTGKPVVVALPGMTALPVRVGSVEFTASLEEAAARVASFFDRALETPPSVPAAITPGYIRGLFCGGSMCLEAMAAVSSVVGKVASNIPLQEEWALADPWHSSGHTFIDFGDEPLTDGRPHPMVDPGLRNDRFVREAEDPAVGVLLLDLVLGYGAHPDPAADLAPLVRQAVRARPDGLTVVVALCGTDEDPQGTGRQAEELRADGAVVTRSAAHAARLALAAAGLRREAVS